MRCDGGRAQCTWSSRCSSRPSIQPLQYAPRTVARLTSLRCTATTTTTTNTTTLVLCRLCSAPIPLAPRTTVVCAFARAFLARGYLPALVSFRVVCCGVDRLLLRLSFSPLSLCVSPWSVSHVISRIAVRSVVGWACPTVNGVCCPHLCRRRRRLLLLLLFLLFVAVHLCEQQWSSS